MSVFNKTSFILGCQQCSSANKWNKNPVYCGNSVAPCFYFKSLYLLYMKQQRPEIRKPYNEGREPDEWGESGVRFENV